MKSRKKRGAEAPPNIKSFISSVTSVPLENIEVPLSGFSWNYEKGDFHHWSDLFHHFDQFFEKYVKPRKDLQLDGDFLEPQDRLPESALLQILRVSRIIFENCANKYLYRSHEHLLSLLASSNPEIVMSALESLAALVKKPAQSTRSVRWHGDSVFNGHLFSLSQGWGGKEEGLGLLSCALEGGCDADAYSLASTLHYEFYAETSDVSGGEPVPVSGLQVIHIPDVHLRPESDLELLKLFIDQYHVPVKLRFSLFTRLRFARAFNSLETRRRFICIRLLAFTALLQSNPDHEDLTAFFVNEPEFVNELVAVLQSESAVPEDIRILAVRALAAQAQDRPRQSNVLSVVSAGGHRGVLPSLVQKAVASLTNNRGTCSIAFAESLLFLVTVLVSSSAGCAALREAGLIPTLLPLLKDTDHQHVDLVTSAVHILEAFMDYSNPAGTLFRDLGGLDDTIMRLQYEVSRVKVCTKDAQDPTHATDKDNTLSSTEVAVSYRQRSLLKALLRAIALGAYASGNTTRLHGSEESALPPCLCSIFRHAKEFGGGVFSLAASVMSDLINKDPTCFPTLQSAGLPSAFLDSITTEVLPSSDAIGCIPHALDALCLNNTGLQAVLDCKAFDCFVKIFTSKVYLKALSGDTAAAIASGLDELMRHAPPLRGPGVDACINILKTIAVIGGASCDEPENPDAPIPMDMDSEQSLSETVLKEEKSESANDTSIEMFLPECINNTVQMLETIFQNADTCRAFIEKKGIEDLLRLFTLPKLPISFGGSSTAYNIFLTFRAFSSQHASTLAKAVCKAVRDHLKTTVGSLVPVKFSDLEPELRDKIARSLSATECFLSLTAFLVRSLSLIMTEINSAGNETFDDIGQIQRWALWQISVADDSKIETKEEESASASGEGNTATDGEARDDDEPETLPVLRYVNSGARSRWGFESEMIPLLPTDHNDRRSRRENVATEILNHVARLGRLARNAAVRTVRGDVESTAGSVDSLSQPEIPKQKSADTLCYEMTTRLAAAARSLYAALSRAMAVPSRHREDSVTVSPVAKAIASSLSILFLKNLEFDGFPGSSSSESTLSVKCRYLGKVVEDVTAVVIDGRKRTCNTIMVNSIYAHGTFKQFLRTFEAMSQHLLNSLSLDTDGAKMEIEKTDDKTFPGSCLADTLRAYTRLMEYFVTASTLLTPTSMAQLLVHPVTGRTVSIPKDPENFVLSLQAQVLEFILPLWNHPLFTKCNPEFIESICSLIKHIYSGVSDVKSQQADVGIENRPSSSPPDESAISLIVEMGFSRARAEEALRIVGNNRVELAMEWLFGHPEEAVQEEDELARALALSLGNGNESSNEEIGKGKDSDSEAIPPLPPVDMMLSTCMNLLNTAKAVTFPLADLMVTLCNRSKGEDRARVISCLIEQLKICKVDNSINDDSPLSTISHLLALVLSEDMNSREIASKNDVVSVALDFLSSFSPVVDSSQKPAAPKWVPALLLVLDFMLQHKPKLDSSSENMSSVGISGPDVTPSTSTKKDEPEKPQKNTLEAIIGRPTGYMTEDEQKRTMAVACKLLHMPLPATSVQAILQLCARLTKVHSIALQFLDAGGLTALLGLPRTCLFPGFDNVAAAIIRHLLEDPQTLQQAMESEIRHSLTASLNRHNNRLSPRMFLTSMARVVARDPAVFMQAASSVCQIEESSGRLYVVLAKEKEKEKDKGTDKEKCKGANDEANAKVEPGTKPSKAHKKVPQSFSHVMEQLLDVVINFAPAEKKPVVCAKSCNSTVTGTAMEVDDVVVKDKGKSEIVNEINKLLSSLSETSAALAKVTFVLKLITEIVLMYSASVSVVLRRDTETSQGKSSLAEGVGHGGLLHGVLHKLVPSPVSSSAEKSSDHELKEKLSATAVHFLVAVCMRSAEGRRRLFSEVAKALVSASTHPVTSHEEGSQPPDQKMKGFVDLLNTVLLSHTSSGGNQAPGVSVEMAKAMLETDMVQALTTLLQVIDLDHPESPKLVSGIAKALEALTRAASVGDNVHDSKKGTENGNRNSDRGVSQNGQSTDIVQHDGSIVRGPGVTIRAILVNADIRRDGQMDHEMGLDQDGNMDEDDDDDEDDEDDEDDDDEDDDRLEAEVEEFMHDAAEVGDVAGMTFMDHGGEDDDEDDDEDMDGDGGEDDEEDEEEPDEDELDDEVALSPPDTDGDDQDDHELEEEYDEDMAEEDEDDDDEWRENRIIGVRWRDGTNGFNHIQVLGHADAASNPDLTMDPFQGMNIDYLFGAFRRPGMGRRPSTYRAFERGAENSRAARHPLLNRPHHSAGGILGSSSWSTAGNVNSRDAEAVLGGSLDVSRLFMYDSALLDHVGDTLFGDRGVGGQDGIFLEFPMLPRLGRRNNRGDSRFSNWADDGQLQGGAVDVALAQAFEEQFVSQFSREQPSSEAAHQQSSDPVAATDHASGRDTANADPTADDRLQGNSNDQAMNVSTGQSHEGPPGLPSRSRIENEQNPSVDVDVHMQDERSTSHVEAASQDSSGSGATVGESLRSLEVEIGSFDGHDETDRGTGADRIDANQASRDRVRNASTDENMDASTPGLPREVPSRGPEQQSVPPDAANTESAGTRVEGTSQAENVDVPMNSIDPTFLEALPEDLRAEVLASQQTGEVRNENQQSSGVDEIDPEFLAALPPEIQAEVLAQQQAQRLLQAQQVEGQPVDMDSASIIATFPAELREEVLLTSSESVLAALPPALLAEARLLRERAMSQLQTRNIFAAPHRLGGRRNNVDGGSSQRLGGISASIDRGVGSGLNFEAGRRPSSVMSVGKGKETEGKPLVDTPALKAILRLLRLAQPLGKGILQRLLYNLCLHTVTCATLVQLLLDMLRPDADKYTSNGLSADGAPPHRLYGCQWNVVYARPQLSDGVPPLVSRRILEILTYLAKHQPLVAGLLLYFNQSLTSDGKQQASDQAREKGKAKMDHEMIEANLNPELEGQIPLVLLLKLLNQPLYSRSSAHLEQVLGLIEVVTSTGLNEAVPTKSGDQTTVDAVVAEDRQATTDASAAVQNGSMETSEADNSQNMPTPSNDECSTAEKPGTSTSTSEEKIDPVTIFLSLPSEELRKLCLLLAREGLSDLAYSRVSEILNKVAEIAPPHRRLFIIELAEAAEKLSGAAIEELQSLSEADTVQFSPTSMAGSAILRVLSALSSLKLSVVSKDSGSEINVEKDKEKDKEEDGCLSVIRELNSAIEPLWQSLSSCAMKIENRLVIPSASSQSTNNLSLVSGGNAAVMPPLSPGTQRVLPFIESFFVLCEKLRSAPLAQVSNELVTATACEIKQTASSSSIESMSRKSDEKGLTFVKFADKHRRLLNAFIRQNPGLLEKSLSLLLKTPRLIDFDNKRSYFKARIRHQHDQQHYSPLRITVRRAYVLEDSYNQLRMRNSDELKGRLTVQFQGEEGIDAGGLTREWYQLLSRVIFDKGALLFTTVGNESTFQPNPNSVYQTEHLSYFKFVGRVVAKALFDGQLLDVYFTRSFYKHILGVKVTYHDIEAVDPDFYKNLKWVLENTVNEALGLTFSIDADEEKHILYERTEVMDHELIPGGRNIRVTEENKHEYVDLVAEHRLTTAIRPQINAFLEGFNELISRDLITIFNDKELELLISGLPEIDLEDLKANTEYTGYTAASPVVQWFWEVVRAFSKEDMARLLQFITGTSKVPLEGFQALQGISGPQKFQIHKAYGAPERLPSAHTCFNQLDLPEYSSKEQLQERLLLAIHEGSEGFGFG